MTIIKTVIPPPTSTVAVPGRGFQGGLVMAANWYKYFVQVAINNLTPSFNSITFPATQVPSTDANTLDDYEEGTWTPGVTLTTPGDLAAVYILKRGTYTKIGNRVFIEFTISTSSFTYSTASGLFRITGLPFTVAAADCIVGAISMQGYTKANYTSLICYGVSSTTVLNILATGSGQAFATLAGADVPSGGNLAIFGAGHYTT